MKKICYTYIIFTVAGFLLGLGYGFIAYRFSLPPYHFFLSNYLTVRDTIQSGSLIPQDNVSDLINLDGKNSVESTRKLLVDLFWGTETLPETSENLTTRPIEKHTYERFKNVLKSVVQLHVEMDYGVDSKMHLFQPKSSNNRLVIYHHGHNGGFAHGLDTIHSFLKENYVVLAVSMPLVGKNSRPVVDIPNLGKFKILDHNQLEFLKPAAGISIRYFIEPIVIAINYLNNKSKFRDINMVGISGGGLVTSLLSSIDERVKKSYSISGSSPFFTNEELSTEYEYRVHSLYSRVNFVTLYTLASLGEKRKHSQIYNRFDPCCNRGLHSNIFENAIKQKITELGGGSFQVFIDRTHSDHKISNYALEYIIDELNSTLVED